MDSNHRYGLPHHPPQRLSRTWPMPSRASNRSAQMTGEAASAALRAARTEKSSPVWLRVPGLPVAASQSLVPPVQARLSIGSRTLCDHASFAPVSNMPFARGRQHDHIDIERVESSFYELVEISRDVGARKSASCEHETAPESNKSSLATTEERIVARPRKPGRFGGHKVVIEGLYQYRNYRRSAMDLEPSPTPLLAPYHLFTHSG